MARVKGHWLDELFGVLDVHSDGELVSDDVEILDFDSESFDVSYDANDKRISISFAGSVNPTLAGDAVGAADANTIQQITGNGGGTVVVLADAFLWDEDVSSGEAELSIAGGETDDGAIQLVLNGKRCFLANDVEPTMGHSTALNFLQGGVRFTTRTISSNVTLDTTTKDMIGIVDASAEREITLPSPTNRNGRCFLFFITGTSSVTIKRSGSEQINGVAGNYVVPFDHAMVIVTTNGTNYFARSFSDTGGGTTQAAMEFSPVDTLRDNNTDAPADTSGDQTSATAFWIRTGSAVTITGIRFYWAGTSNQVIKTVLYSAAGAVLATANVTTAGAGVYTSTFSVPYSASSGLQYKAAAYDTSGAGKRYTKVSNSSLTAGLVPARPFFGGRRIGWINFGLWLAGDNNPTSTAANEWYLVEPVISE